MSDACTVRALTEEDLPMVLAWRNHPSVRSCMLTQHEISLEEHRNWFARVKEDKARQHLIVLDGADPLGFVQFNPVCQGGIADWGFYVRPDAPKGTGTKLGQAALLHGFNIFGLHKVCGQAIENNVVSIAFHQKLGFREEGRLREQQRIGDHYHTLVCFGLLVKEWQERIQREVDPYATN
jgi:UDP-4-amino-4,6-dideoxy-N-acetyl-beta-L-altrosamine N-acetyltransferase